MTKDEFAASATKKRVVIWGDDHHNALGLLRMLGGRGFDILLIVRKNKNIATASKYCARFVEISDLEEGLQYLFENYSDKQNKAVLLFTADRYSEIANENLSKLSEYFIVCGPDKESVLIGIDDKYSMSILARECGFNIPRSILLPMDNIDDIDFFPVILKPCRPVSKDFKTLVAKNHRELHKAYKKLISGKRYILQQYISKKADCLVYGCRTQQNNTIVAGACVRNRWSDDGCGSFGYITPDLPKGVDESQIASFLSKINFHGLFSVEYAITEGEAYFYEFNLRNDGTSHLFYQAGANIALAYVNSCFNCAINEPVRVQEKKYLINEFWDRFNVNDRIISKLQYENDYNRSSIFFYYDPDDMKPYNIQKSLTTRRKIRRIIKKSVINKIRLRIKAKLRK